MRHGSSRFKRVKRMLGARAEACQDLEQDESKDSSTKRAGHQDVSQARGHVRASILFAPSHLHRPCCYCERRIMRPFETVPVRLLTGICTPWLAEMGRLTSVWAMPQQQQGIAMDMLSVLLLTRSRRRGRQQQNVLSNCSSFFFVQHPTPDPYDDDMLCLHTT
jgi:hypothetical protein